MTGTSGRGFCVRTGCGTVAEFIAKYQSSCDSASIFVETDELLPIEQECAFALLLADDRPVLAGVCVVLAPHPDGDSPLRRRGMRLGIKRLGPDSQRVFAQLSRARTRTAESTAPRRKRLRTDTVEMTSLRATTEPPAASSSARVRIPTRESRGPGQPMPSAIVRARGSTVSPTDYENPVPPRRSVQIPAVKPATVGPTEDVAPTGTPASGVSTSSPSTSGLSTSGVPSLRIVLSCAVVACVAVALTVFLSTMHETPSAQAQVFLPDARLAIEEVAPVVMAQVAEQTPPSPPPNARVGLGPCGLGVASEPAGALVRVEGWAVGTTPLEVWGPCKKRWVQVALAKHTPITRYMKPKRGSAIAVELKLRRAQASKPQRVGSTKLRAKLLVVGELRPLNAVASKPQRLVAPPKRAVMPKPRVIAQLKR